MVKAILFDLDETLYDERQFRYGGLRAVSRWLVDEGISNRSDLEDVILSIAEQKGVRYSNLFQSFLTAVGLPASLSERMLDVYRAHCPKLTLYEDAERVLEKLSGYYRLGIVTEGLGYIQDAKVRALDLDRWFAQDSVVVTGKLPGSPSKLEAAPFLEAELRLDCSGSECLYVGDNPSRDFCHPNKLGWYTVRLLRGQHSEDDALHSAKAAIHEYGELEDLLVSMEEKV